MIVALGNEGFSAWLKHQRGRGPIQNRSPSPLAVDDFELFI
ncbi:hypothetical protein [Spirosoma pomorum]